MDLNEICRLAEIMLHAVVDKLPEMKAMFFEALEFGFGPKQILYQAILAVTLQGAAMGIESVRELLKYCLSFLTAKGRKQRQLLTAMSQSTSYGQWKQHAEELDALHGFDKWRKRDESSFFDSRVLKKRIEDTVDMMRRGDVFDLLFRLRGGEWRGVDGGSVAA